MPPTPPTDAELDAMIIARLAAMGIDLTQLPAGSDPDPDTGSPGQTTALTSLRAFVRGTVATIAAYDMPVPGGLDPADPYAPALAQQRAPLMYPSIAEAWRA